MTTESALPATDTRYRVQPSVGVGIGVALAYMVVCFGIQASSGIDYEDWFLTADNAYRAAVLPLAVCSVLLIAFLAWARWDIVWRDPGRLAMSGLMKAVLIMFAVAIVVRVVGIDWGEVPGDLLLAVILSSVLVGFAEEILFRGVFLRCMRTRGRAEGMAALWTAVGFGLFHLPNIFIGTGAKGLGQILLAGLSGGALYLFRRNFAFIVPAMIAHGLWDFSSFLDLNYGATATTALSFLLTAAIAVAVLVILIKLARHEHDVVTPQGIVGVGHSPSGRA